MYITAGITESPATDHDSPVRVDGEGVEAGCRLPRLEIIVNVTSTRM